MTPRLRWLTGLLAGLLLPMFARAEMRTWTSVSGATVEARLTRETEEAVELETRDGRALSIQKASLSEADRRFLVGPTGAPDPPPAAPEDPAPSDPSAPPGFPALFGPELINARRQPVPVSELAGKVVGIYFSAGWNRPCVYFAPRLIEAYEEIRRRKKPFEIVFVSFDHSEREMRDYMRSTRMPWLALPFDSPASEAIKKRFRVHAPPRLVILDATGKTLHVSARHTVVSDGADAWDTWLVTGQ